MEIITIQDAKEQGLKWYFTGEPCSNGHVDKRYVNTKICYQCKREINKRNATNNPQTKKQISDRTYLKNREKRIKGGQRWAENNRDKSNKIKKNYKIKHQHKVQKAARDYQQRKRSIPHTRLSMCMSKAIWECLKNKKNQKRWESFVKYSLKDLILHLEKQFKPGMSWENYGPYWHIDHIKPLSSFNLETEFELAWDIDNLRPLEAILNLKKGSKLNTTI